MTGSKRIVGLSFMLLAVLAAHMFMDYKQKGTARRLGHNSIVPGADEATTIVLSRPDSKDVRLGLADQWTIEAPYMATVEQSVVLRMLDALAFVPIQTEMSDAELLRIGRMRLDFGLEAPRLTLTLTWKGADATTVTFGDCTPAGDGVYATINDSDHVYIVGSNVFAAVNQPADSLRCRRVFSLASENVDSFDVKNGTGHFLRFSREGDIWHLVEPATSMASSSRIRKFLEEILQLRAAAFVWPVGESNETTVVTSSLLAGYGLDAESAMVLTLKGGAGLCQTASFGRDAGDGYVYACVGDGTTIVTVPVAVRNAALSGVETFIDPRLFPVDAAEVSALSFKDDNVTHLLSRDAEGVWRLDAPVSAAADGKAVDELLDRIRSLDVSDLVETNGVFVSVGTNAEPVAVSRASLFPDCRPADLRSKTVVRIEQNNIKRLVVTDYDQPPVAVLFDSARSVWTIERAEGQGVVDVSAVTRLAEALNPLTAARIVRLKVSTSELGLFGLDKPCRTIAVDQSTKDSVRRNILIGDVTDGGRYATLGSFDAVFVLSTECVKNLLSPIVKQE